MPAPPDLLGQKLPVSCGRGSGTVPCRPAPVPRGQARPVPSRRAPIPSHALTCGRFQSQASFKSISRLRSYDSRFSRQNPSFSSSAMLEDAAKSRSRINPVNFSKASNALTIRSLRSIRAIAPPEPSHCLSRRSRAAPEYDPHCNQAEAGAKPKREDQITKTVHALIPSQDGDQ